MAVTQAGEAALQRCWHIIGGKRDSAAMVWNDSINAKQQYQLLLEATHNRATARTYAGVPWEQVPKTLYVKIRIALRQQIARAEQLAAALESVQ